MATTIEQRRKQLQAELMDLQRQVDAMDGKVRAYLADRENKPHPRHQEFVEKIQMFRIDPSISNRQLETVLDNLQWKVHYYHRAWRQLWDNAEMMRRENARNLRTAKTDTGAGKAESEADQQRSIYSVDRLWNLQREKLEQFGENGIPESKDAFVKRIKKRYGQLASEKTENDEIVMTFNKQEQRCTLEIKRKKSDT